MGWRFRKSFSLAPGVRLNLGRRGIMSMSVGRRGATINVGNRGVKGTVSIPGTGLSYQHRFLSLPTGPKPGQANAAPVTPSNSPAPSGGRAFLGCTILIIGILLAAGYLAWSGTDEGRPSRTEDLNGVRATPSAATALHAGTTTGPSVPGTGRKSLLSRRWWKRARPVSRRQSDRRS